MESKSSDIVESGKSINVVYIAYVPYGFEVFEQFISSYLMHAAGVEHKLSIVFKGSGDDRLMLDVYFKLLSEKNIAYDALYFEEGQDIDTYFYAATQIQADYFFFLNTHSILLTGNWLMKFYLAINKTNAGVVSSTASWQSYYSTVFKLNNLTWDSGKGFLFNFRKYKLIVKAFFYWKFLFKPFPNPHFRTNAFIIRKEIFLKIKHNPTKTKLQAYRFESGRNGITQQLLKMGYDILLVNSAGDIYKEAEWKNSRTFWMQQQELLAVADKQTMMYQNAEQAEQNKLTGLAWG